MEFVGQPWTAHIIDWPRVVRIEVAAVAEADGMIVRCPADIVPNFYSVYSAGAELGEVACIADRRTVEEALSIADDWAAEYGLPVLNLTSTRKTCNAHVA